MNPFDKVRAALQEVLDAEGDGYYVAHWVAVLGIERVDGVAAGIRSSAWVAVPLHQADYITDGLLMTGCQLRDGADLEDE